MKLIAHRGNIQGSNPLLENNPVYVFHALQNGFEAEIDVWFLGGRFYLGHDVPRYPIDESYLDQEGLWCHAKNLEALEKMKSKKIHCFWHQNDDYTLTSRGYTWVYPGKPAPANSILVILGKAFPDKKPLDIAGYCGDYVSDWKGMSL